VTEQAHTVPSWLPALETTPVPQARSLQEMSEAVFRTQDLVSRQDEEADAQRQRSHALKLSEAADEAEVAAWMGRPVMGAVEYFLAASEEADRQEEQDRKHAAARRAEAAEMRVAELEAQLAEAHTRSERLGRNFSRANEGWGRARQEAASFRDAHYRSYYR
jgi:hypothetical protein